MYCNTNPVSRIADVPTPCFLLDLNRLKENARSMIDRCKALNITLRPHMKTHKSVEAGEIQTSYTKRCICVSTLEEARFFADAGFDDILYAYPLTADKLECCRELTNQLSEFHVMLESVHGLNAIKSSSLDDGKKWSVFVDVDCGYGRSGMPWNGQDLIDLCKDLVTMKSSVTFRGIYTHDGNSYTCKSVDEIQNAAGVAAERLSEAAARLQQHGITCDVIATGSTPSCSKPPNAIHAVTEFHPGNYIFYDWMQSMLGTCALDNIACRVATRVIGHNISQKQLLIDAGFLAVSQDGMKQNYPTGCCLFQDNHNLKLVGMTQELGKVSTVSGSLDLDKYPVGTMLFIYPHHSCATAAMFPIYHVHTGENIVAKWRPTRGW